MKVEYRGFKEINGPLVVIDGIKDASYDEIVEITEKNGNKRLGKIIEVSDDAAIVQVFEGTRGLSLDGAVTALTGKPLEIGVSKDILGRMFDGAGRPSDGLGEVFADE